MSIRVLEYPPERAPELRRFLEGHGFRFEDRPHAAFLARRGPGLTLTAYLSGKLLATGAEAEEFAGVVAAEGLATMAETRDRASRRQPVHAHLESFPRTGLDEAGKGDYFGPLVTAAVHVPDRAAEAALTRLGVRDSKRVTDGEVLRLAAEIEERYPVARIVVNPPRYNELYEEVGNLNDVLAWGHVRALEEIASRTGDRGLGIVVLDRFENRGRVTGRVGGRFPGVEVVEVPRAEADPVVAAASIVARAAFLSRLDLLSKRYGVALAKGAGAPVLRSMRDLVELHGRERLREVAKLHFRTTGQGR